jgi:hypothetical protein
MLAGTLVYINAGTQLAQINSLSGIVSPGLLLSFAVTRCVPHVGEDGSWEFSAESPRLCQMATSKERLTATWWSSAVALPVW